MTDDILPARLQPTLTTHPALATQLALSGLQSNAATGWQEMSLSHSSSALPTTPSYSPVCLSATTLHQGRMGEQP